MKLAIIGGGAAGIFASIIAASKHPDVEVTVFERTEQLLSKVKISGGGRCNVTHSCFDPKVLIQNYPRGSKELLAPFIRFQPKDTIAWFQERGVYLKTEKDGRMFPTTDSSETIIRCLLQEAEKCKVSIRKGEKIQSVERGFVLHSSSERIQCDRLLLATGSSSHGHELAKQLGHSIIEPVPSLFTFNVPNSPLEDLAGVSLEKATVSIMGTNLEQTGPLLITHWGFSGPAVLKLSAWGARILHEKKYQAEFQIRWVPDLSLDSIFQKISEQKNKSPKQTIASEPLFSLPKSLWKRFITLLEIDPEAKWNSFSKTAMHVLANKLYKDPYQISGKTTYKQEFVTCGGVKLSEVNFKTMESRICPGLYFSGEILDIDGITGGFNFQAAWTTAWIAAEGL